MSKTDKNENKKKKVSRGVINKGSNFKIKR